MYTVGSLFTGIGGIDLAFERAGFTIAWQCEIDDYCNRVLERHWPGVPRFRDVRTVSGTTLSACDVLVGGFPCQDISSAGRGEGIQVGNRSGLWFEFARLIGDLRPRYVFIENVPAITSNGGTTVLNDLAARGYDAQWRVVAAADAAAPHQRDRWFCVAYRARPNGKLDGAVELQQASAGSVGNPRMADSDGSRELQLSRFIENGVLLRTGDGSTDVADTARLGVEGLRAGWEQKPALHAESSVSMRDSTGSVESRLGGIFDGLPTRLDAARRSTRWPSRPGEAQHQWEAPRVATGVPHRTARLKALGNAVVPQVVQPFAEGIREALEDEDRE